MKRTTIWQRIAVPMGLLVLGGIVGLTLVLFGYRSINIEYEAMLRLSDENNAIHRLVEALNEQLRSHLDYVVQPSAASLSTAVASRDAVSTAFGAYDALAGARPTAEWQERWAAINNALDEQARMVEAGESPADIRNLQADITARFSALHGLLEATDVVIDESVAAQRAEVDAQRRVTNWAFIGLFAYALVGGTGTALYLSRAVSRELTETVAVLSSSAAELTAQAQTQATGASEQAAAVTEVTATVEELSQTANQIAESADRVAQSVQLNQNNAEAAQQAMNETAAGMEALKEKVHSLTARILVLGEKAQQIGAVVNIINDFADDTHLLALNASIEAAGAGEYGKRFAVVAAEVKRLAERVLQAAGEIRALVGEVQSATNAAVVSAEDGAREAERGSALAGRSGASISEIRNQVAVNAGLAHEISLATRQQRQASEQVARTMHEVAAIAQQAAEAGRQSAGAAEQLEGVAHILAALLGSRNMAQYRE